MQFAQFAAFALIVLGVSASPIELNKRGDNVKTVSTVFVTHNGGTSTLHKPSTTEEVTKTHVVTETKSKKSMMDGKNDIDNDMSVSTVFVTHNGGTLTIHKPSTTEQITKTHVVTITESQKN